MNYLQLCQRLRQESGIAESGPSQVTGQVGDMKRLVDWINESWVRLQSSRPDWAFMWTTGSLAINAGTSQYSLPATLEAVTPGTLYLDGSRLADIAYPDYRQHYQTLQTGKPTGYSIRPDGALVLNATPDAAYTLSYEGYNKPVAFVSGTDAPNIPDRFHILIVWDALLQYALFDEAPELMQKAQLNYAQLYAELDHDQLPAMEFAGPIA